MAVDIAHLLVRIAVYCSGREDGAIGRRHRTRPVHTGRQSGHLCFGRCRGSGLAGTDRRMVHGKRGGAAAQFGVWPRRSFVWRTWRNVRNRLRFAPVTADLRRIRLRGPARRSAGSHHTYQRRQAAVAGHGRLVRHTRSGICLWTGSRCALCGPRLSRRVQGHRRARRTLSRGGRAAAATHGHWPRMPPQPRVHACPCCRAWPPRCARGV